MSYCYENVTRLLAPTEVNVAANMITGWGKVMDAIERVANVLIGSRGNSYCDACLASNLTLQSRQEAQQVITALAGSASFQRSFSSRSICGRERILIGSNRRTGFSGSDNGEE